MSSLTHQKRFEVIVDQTDYDSLHDLGRAVSPPANLKYLMRLGVRHLVDPHGAEQHTFSRERRS